MKATGIVRRIDNLGRIVVPKEMRRILKIREGDPIEIYAGIDGEIVLKKYSHLLDMMHPAEEFAETAAGILGTTVVISDTDNYIAAGGKEKKQYINTHIDEDLDNIIQSKKKYLHNEKAVVPILYQGDAIGSVSIIPPNEKNLGEIEFKTAELGAEFLSKQVYD